MLAAASTFALDCWSQKLKILEAAAGWGTGSSQMVIPSLAVVVGASREDSEAAGNFKKRIKAEVSLNEIILLEMKPVGSKSGRQANRSEQFSQSVPST